MAEEEAVAQLKAVLRCSVEDEDVLTVALHRLIQLSRSPNVRSVLATCDTVSSILPLIAQDSSSLLLVLRFLRNLCAGNLCNQEAFLRSSGVHFVALVVDRSLSAYSQKHIDTSTTLQVCLQLLGNACGEGSAQRDAVWKAFFPDRFRTLALVKNDGILEPLCMVIYTCIHEDIQRQRALCERDGALLLSSCLQAEPPQGALSTVSDWIYLLLLDLCSKQSLVPLLFTNLRVSSEECSEEPQFSVEQVSLLGCLLHILSEEHFDDTVLQSKIDLISIVEFLAQILKDASSFYLSSHLSTSNVIPHATRPCGIPVIDVLGYTLESLKVLSGLDCGHNESGKRCDPSSVVGELLQKGIIELCLELLESLGPPELIFRAMQRSDAEIAPEYSNGVQQAAQCMNDCGEDTLKVTRAALPYLGFRRDLVAVIGNAAYQNQAVQDAVRCLGGLFLLLQQCVVDEANPFLREWGLWAIRNLVDGNMENSKEIAELQLRVPVTPVELAERGYKVEMDLALRRPKLVNMPSRSG